MLSLLLIKVLGGAGVATAALALLLFVLDAVGVQIAVTHDREAAILAALLGVSLLAVAGWARLTIARDRRQSLRAVRTAFAAGVDYGEIRLRRSMVGVRRDDAA